MNAAWLTWCHPADLHSYAQLATFLVNAYRVGSNNEILKGVIS
jgi:hypothetical protein